MHRLTKTLRPHRRRKEDARKLSEQFARVKFLILLRAGAWRVTEQSGRIEQPSRATEATGRAGGRARRAACPFAVSRPPETAVHAVDVEIKTGRTHQIRVHLQWLKHPVVGDEVYGDGRDKTVTDARVRALIARLNRLFLHAEQLGFHHPRTQERLRFTAPLPAELTALLGILETI